MMAPPEWRDDEDISLFAVATMLLRSRWRLARWMVAGAVLATVFALLSRPQYRAAASFIPQGYDNNRSGIASLAGQLGVSVPTQSGNASLSPDFYIALLGSRALLAPVVRDTFAVPELNQQHIAFVDLFQVGGATPAVRDERAVALLRRLVSPSASKTTGVVEVAVSTEWRSVSLAIATALMAGINDFNQQMRQGQAASERKFIEGRLSEATAALRTAEDRLSEFERSNRVILGSPTLQLDRDRLQRDVGFRQQVVSNLTQSYEDARIREVRDTPVITAFEAPYAPPQPEPRGRLKKVLTGAAAGLVIGIFLSLISGITTLRRRSGDAEAAEFTGVLSETKRDLLRPFRLFGRTPR